MKGLLVLSLLIFSLNIYAQGSVDKFCEDNQDLFGKSKLIPNMTGDSNIKGFQVLSVDKNSILKFYNIQEEDVILSLNDEFIDSPMFFMNPENRSKFCSSKSAFNVIRQTKSITCQPGKNCTEVETSKAKNTIAEMKAFKKQSQDLGKKPVTFACYEYRSNKKTLCMEAVKTVGVLADSMLEMCKISAEVEGKKYKLDKNKSTCSRSRAKYVCEAKDKRKSLTTFIYENLTNNEMDKLRKQCPQKDFVWKKIK